MDIKNLLYILTFVFIGLTININASEKIMKLENPITVKYLIKNLKKTHPRLVLNEGILEDLRKKVKSDPVTKAYYQAIKNNAEKIKEKAFLTRKMTGRRLLSVSREMLYRMNVLSIIYLIEKDPKILKRINDEIVAVCKFTDWNPSHFLDVAEMSLAVALALDWTKGDLPKETIELAKESLIEKGINPSWGKKMWWSHGNNNWNQVCNCGMIAASITIAEKNPELASKTIKRALDGIPNALVEYAPDGVYPEGGSYWYYGTGFTVMTIEMLRSSLGTDFNISKSPGFLKSAMFRSLMVGPSGYFFNFADCGDKPKSGGDTVLMWFARETGNPLFFEKELFLKGTGKKAKLPRNAGAALIWISQFKEKEGDQAPKVWKGDGSNPVVIFKEDDYYFGGKGGRGTVNHGNMDAGTFVFETDGIRWVVDPGSQNYNALEKEGFKLWGKEQNSERWKLLTKNNYGHSTLTVDDKLHVVNGLATIEDFKKEPVPQATINLTATFKGQLKSAKRKFTRDTPTSLTIEDDIELEKGTKKITWQLITRSEVELIDGGAILKEKGKQLKLANLSHPEIPIKIVSLAPPPFKLDRVIKNLKRLEINIQADKCKDGKTKIKVRLSK